MNGISRREFIGTAATAGGILLAGGFAVRPLAAAENAGWPASKTVKIHVV